MLSRIISALLFIAIPPLTVFLMVLPGPWAILFMPFVIAYALTLWDPERFPYRVMLRKMGRTCVKLLKNRIVQITAVVFAAGFAVWFFMFRP